MGWIGLLTRFHKHKCAGNRQHRGVEAGHLPSEQILATNFGPVNAEQAEVLAPGLIAHQAAQDQPLVMDEPMAVAQGQAHHRRQAITAAELVADFIHQALGGKGLEVGWRGIECCHLIFQFYFEGKIQLMSL
jgi:hypothetical protein